MRSAADCQCTIPGSIWTSSCSHPSQYFSTARDEPLFIPSATPQPPCYLFRAHLCILAKPTPWWERYNRSGAITKQPIYAQANQMLIATLFKVEFFTGPHVVANRGCRSARGTRKHLRARCASRLCCAWRMTSKKREYAYYQHLISLLMKTFSWLPLGLFAYYENVLKG